MKDHPFTRVMSKNKNIILYLLLFIIFSLPRSLNNATPPVGMIVNALKSIAIVTTLVITIIKRPKFSRTTCIFFVYFIYLFFTTEINFSHIMTFAKTYSLNVAVILLAENILQSRASRKIVKVCSDYLLFLLSLNFIQVCLFQIIGHRTENGYILGLDNRFILYIIPTILGYYYTKSLNSKSTKYKLYATYIIGILSTLLVWSASALVVMFFIIASMVITKKYQRFHLNTKLLSLIILAISAALVLFKFQNIFQPFIVGVLHKDLTFSHRTAIWDLAINILSSHPINLFFGFGFYNFINVLGTLPNTAMHVIHFHNLIVNTCFAGGLIGLSIYIYGLFSVASNVDRINNKLSRTTFGIILLGLLVLLTFDTFEYYQLYYYILILLTERYRFDRQNIDIIKTRAKLLSENQSDKVAIMLATYNGGKLLDAQLKSIVNQSYKNWIIYISDDGSTDNTISIIEKYKKKYNKKIVLIKKTTKPHGAKNNFAFLFKKTPQFNYYMFSDQDDIWDKDKILYMLSNTKEQEKNFSKHTPILTYCDAEVTDKNLRTINESLIKNGFRILPKKNILPKLLVQGYFPGCTIMFNYALKRSTKIIYSKTEMHDWWISLVAAMNGKISFLDLPLHYYRQHDNNTIGAHLDKPTPASIIKKARSHSYHSTWEEYQEIILHQAKELRRRYYDITDKKNRRTITRFINIMEEHNRSKRFIKLLLSPFYPIDKIRILRLVLK